MPNTEGLEKKNWFALYTKPRHEFKAVLHLESKGIENYLPTIVKTKKWSDRKKKISEPIFKGYVFIYVNEKERLLSLQNPAIVKTVTFNGKPAVIPGWQIENLNIMLSEDPEVFVSDRIELGTKVKIISGPFSDVVGIVKELNNDTWLAVSIDLLQRSILVRLTQDNIVRILED